MSSLLNKTSTACQGGLTAEVIAIDRQAKRSCSNSPLTRWTGQVVTVFEVARADFVMIPKIGRWRCPVCNHWVDEKAGWRITQEEEICIRCFIILKGGKIDGPTDSQWKGAT